MTDLPEPPPPAKVQVRPPRRRRWGHWLEAALGLPLALLFVAAGIVAGSERGLRYTLDQVTALTAGAIQFGSVNGRLIDAVEIRNFRFAGGDGLTVTIDRIALRHDIAALLDRRLHIESLVVDTLDIRLAPPKQDPEPDTPINLPTRWPLDLQVDALSLNAFTLRRHDAKAEPIVALDASTLAASWVGDRITVQSLSTTGLPITGPLRATGQLTMGRSQLDFAALDISGPGTVTGTGRLGLGTVDSDLKLGWQQLHWPLNLPDNQRPLAGAMDGQLAFTGRFDAYRFSLQSTATLQDFAATLNADGSGSLEQLRIDTLALDALPVELTTAAARRNSKPQPGSVKASGTVAWSPKLLAAIEAEFHHVDPSWFVADFPGDLNGRISSSTTLIGDEPTIAFTGRFENSSLRGQPFALSANGVTDTRGAALETLALKAGHGTVDAKVEVRWAPALEVDVEATLARFDPAVVLPDWPGDLNGRLSAKTDARSERQPIRFAALIERSRLRGYRVQFDTAGSVTQAEAGTVVALDRAKLVSGSTTLEASGQVTPPFSIRASVNSPDLAALLPELSGRAALTLALDGTLEAPHLLSSGNVRSVAHGDRTVARLDWEADLAPAVNTSRLSVELRDAELGMRVDKLSLSLAGMEVYHRVLLDTTTERGDAKLGLIGGFDRARGEWGGELNLLQLAPTEMAGWALAKPAGVLLGQKRRALEPACLEGQDGRACFNLEQNVLADGARIGWNIDHLLLSALKPFLGDSLQVAGHVDGEGFINFTGGDLQQARAALHLRDTTVDLPDAPTYRIDVGTITANQVDGVLDATAEVRLPGAALTAQVTAAPGSLFTARTLGGQVRLDVPDLGFVEPLLPQFDQLGGRLAGDLALSGTLGDPRYTGDIRLSDGAARLAVAGIDLRDLDLVLKTRGSEPLSLAGSAQSGNGRLKVDGEINPYTLPLTADIKVNGRDFQAMNTPQARAWIDADVQLIRNAAGARLTGELAVPRADITPKGLGGGGVEASADEVLVGVEVPEKDVPLPVTVDLRLKLGERVQIEGYGLKTHIEGAVNLTQRPGFEALGRGELRLIDGRYQAYGQDLSIETGRLIFSGGPVTTPAVDLYATRQPREDIKVGVRVRGTLAKPELSLQSSPSLPREQQLSWLVLGRSLENTSTQDRSMVSSAALSLGLGGGDYLAGLIGKKVGLDELSVGGAAVNNSEVAANAQSISGAQNGAGAVDAGAQAAQLTLGKYLTPKLFVSYGISLFQEGYTFRMLYTLGRGFKLSTESGTASGGDVIYTTERGKRDPKASSRPPVDPVPAAGPPPDPTRNPDGTLAPDPVVEREAGATAP